MRSSTPTADTRAAQAALARLSLKVNVIDRFLVVDDTDQDATQILTVLLERTCATHNSFAEVHS